MPTCEALVCGDGLSVVRCPNKATRAGFGYVGEATVRCDGHLHHFGRRQQHLPLDLDMSDLYAPTPGDAVALRGGVLVEAEAWDLLAFDEAKFEAAELNAQRIALREPARAARIRDLVGRMRAKTVAHVEREAGL